jgi:Tol biopolymer transport system component
MPKLPRSLAALPAVCAFAAAASAQYGITSRASVAAYGGDVDHHSGAPSLSADGRFVAFHSRASNLFPLSQGFDGNSAFDIFVRDLLTGTTRRVSIGIGGFDPVGGSGHPSISADGSRVAFHSFSWNLVANDSNQALDVFVVDVATLATTRVSVISGGAQATGMSQFASLSADGRYVVFESWAADLAPGDGNLACDIFRHDTLTGVTELVSANPAGVSGNGDSGGDSVSPPSISADGRWVAFGSRASDLVPNDTNHITFPLPCKLCGDDVFVRDMLLGTTVKVSVSSAGVPGDWKNNYCAISGDGRLVVFEGASANLVPGDTNDAGDVFVHDRDADVDGIFDEPGAIATTRVSVDSSGAQMANGAGGGGIGWGGPRISFDGSTVAFHSISPLAPPGSNGRIQVFVKDLASGLVEATSVDPWFALGAEHSFLAALDANGDHVAFTTRSTGIVAGETNARDDVFVRRACPQPATYCTAKLNSLGCAATLSTFGVPGATLPAPFTITTSNLRSQVAGLTIYSLAGASATPFQGGHLCVQAPFARTPIQPTGGNPAGNDCSGSLAFDFNAYVASGANPALVDGVTVWAQSWSRDGGDPFGSNLSGGVTFVLSAP